MISFIHNNNMCFMWYISNTNDSLGKCVTAPLLPRFTVSTSMSLNTMSVLSLSSRGMFQKGVWTSNGTTLQSAVDGFNYTPIWYHIILYIYIYVWYTYIHVYMYICIYAYTYICVYIYTQLIICQARTSWAPSAWASTSSPSSWPSDRERERERERENKKKIYIYTHTYIYLSPYRGQILRFQRRLHRGHLAKAKRGV